MDNNEIYNLSDEADFIDDPNASIIKVIGVGGGGSNAVNYMFHQDIPNVNFVVCNTDKQHLNEMQVPTKLLLGWGVTKGRGAGNKPEVGRQCAEESTEEIKRLFVDGTEMVFITLLGSIVERSSCLLQWDALHLGNIRSKLN